MKYLPAPTDENSQPLAAGEVFEACVSMISDADLKARLRAVRPDVEAEAEDYNAKAADTELYRKETHDHVGAVSGVEMVKVYKLRMVPKKSKGRPIYNRILTAPLHGRCPLCGIGTVNTLDHYLPKTHFPVYAVTPNNLVPACLWCQKAKEEYYSTTEAGQLLHPYFDDIDDEIWLAAEVIQGAPAGFRYFASPPDHWTPLATARVGAHLRKLGLALLFASNAGSRLSEIRDRLTRLLAKGGYDAVREHLLEDLVSLESDQKNSWATAMYRAAVASDWFCRGGFQET
jgi:hypothetical protein